MKRVREKLTYANVMSTLAVVLVIGGGTAFAASHLGKNVVKSRNIAPGAVTAKDIARSAVKRGRIGRGAVDSARLARNAVARGKIAAGAVSVGQLDSDSVVESKIADSAVTTAKLAPDAVEEAKLAATLRRKVNYMQAGGVIRLNADPTAVSATEHTLITRGPFRIYAKCWLSGSSTSAQVYVTTSQPGALAFGTTGSFVGGLNSSYLDSNATENNRKIATANSVSTAAATSLSGAVTLVKGSTSIQVSVAGFIRGSTVAGDAGNYGAGNERCVFSSLLVAPSG